MLNQYQESDIGSGIIEIDGRKWYTRERFLLEYGIKKSSFYNQVKSGNILSRKLFEHPNTLFYVYSITMQKEVCDD